MDYRILFLVVAVATVSVVHAGRTRYEIVDPDGMQIYKVVIGGPKGNADNPPGEPPSASDPEGMTGEPSTTQGSSVHDGLRALSAMSAEERSDALRKHREEDDQPRTSRWIVLSPGKVVRGEALQVEAGEHTEISSRCGTWEVPALEPHLPGMTVVRGTRTRIDCVSIEGGDK